MTSPKINSEPSSGRRPNHSQGRGLSLFLWIAIRNLTVRKKRSGLSFMTVISIMGVTLGVAALMIVLSVMGGFEEDLKGKMLRGQPHLEIMHQTAAIGFGLKTLSLDEIKRLFPEAVDMQPFTQMDVVLKQSKHMGSGVLFGVDPTRKDHLWGFSGAVVEGDMSTLNDLHRPMLESEADGKTYPGIALGDELALQLGAAIGDIITVLSPQSGVEAALGGGTVQRQFVLTAKFSTGLFNYDGKWAVVNLDEGRKFLPDYDPSLDEDGYVSGVAMNLAEPMAVDAVEERFARLQETQGPDGLLSSLQLLSWKKVNKSLLFALKLEKFAMGSILMLIVVVAAFSISSTMMMMVFHKRAQVSLLRSLGMTRGDIKRIYLSHGFMIGTVGIAIGLLLGLAVCALIKSFEFIPLPAGVYHLTKLPVKWLWFDYGVIAAFAWIFSVIASLYPAVTAAKQDPGVGLRHG